MKLLIDAQLPRRLADWFIALGHDAVHTLQLPAGNRTTDSELNRLAMVERRIVVTKDSDFVDSFLVTGLPQQLLLVATGNIHNSALLKRFAVALQQLDSAFQSARFVELTLTDLIVHQ
ncbi:MAG: hypothetical protein EXS05_07455 [Planctomycetaceae bacterium]|nr:hypothetical protein [Planctomycetaceae bacterium]